GCPRHSRSHRGGGSPAPTIVTSGPLFVSPRYSTKSPADSRETSRTSDSAITRGYARSSERAVGSSRVGVASVVLETHAGVERRDRVGADTVVGPEPAVQGD